MVHIKSVVLAILMSELLFMYADAERWSKRSSADLLYKYPCVFSIFNKTPLCYKHSYRNARKTVDEDMSSGTCGTDATPKSGMDNGSDQENDSGMAQTAAKEAQIAAALQPAEGHAADYKIKEHLAEQAKQAAKAAHAAYVSKKQVVAHYKEALADIRRRIEINDAELEAAERSYANDEKVLQEWEDQVAVMTELARGAKANLELREKEAEEAQAAIQRSHNRIKTAKEQYEASLQQIKEAEINFEKLKLIAEKAAEVAQWAREVVDQDDCDATASGSMENKVDVSRGVNDGEVANYVCEVFIQTDP